MKKIILVITALIITFSAQAQIESHVKWQYAFKKVSATEAVVLIKANIDKDWHIYSQNVAEGGPVKPVSHLPHQRSLRLLVKLPSQNP